MVKKFLKFVHKSRYRDVLLKALKDLQDDNLADYDVKVLKWIPNQKRIRIWSIRIIFIETEEWYKIVEINNRGDIY